MQRHMSERPRLGHQRVLPGDVRAGTLSVPMLSASVVVRTNHTEEAESMRIAVHSRVPFRLTSPREWRRAAFIALAVPLLMIWPATTVLANFAGTNGRIVFMVNGQVFSVRPSGADLRQLTHLGDDHTAAFPKVSAGGRRIVYMSDASGSPQVWVMRLDGSHQHQVSHDPDYDPAYPTWSPDGASPLHAARTSWARAALPR